MTPEEGDLLERTREGERKRAEESVVKMEQKEDIKEGRVFHGAILALFTMGKQLL